MKIRIVKTIGQAVIIQNELYERRTVPARAIKPGDVISMREWKAGIHYGIPWEDVVTINATPESLAMELRKRGVYTRKDLEKRIKSVQAAVYEAVGVDLSALIRAAKAYQEV